MKCPKCNTEMKRLVQTYPAKYGIPDTVLYHHPKDKCKLSEFTLCANEWQKQYGSKSQV